MKQIISMTGIHKRFGPTQALAGADFSLSRGEIHGLAGENGAGKTTLMRVLFGLVRPDRGTIAINGRPVDLRSPREAIAAGLAMVHQHLMLVPSLTVLENVVLGAEPRRNVGIDRKKARDTIAGPAENLGLGPLLDRRVEHMSLGEAQRVEILKALYRGAGILILDEPTAALTPQESSGLLDIVGGLAERGVTVVLIDHKLAELAACCSSVTVLRRGKDVARLVGGEVEETALLRLLTGGKDLAEPVPAGADNRPGGLEKVLLVSGLRSRPEVGGRLEAADLSVERGEVHGLAGSEASGGETLLRVLSGIIPAAGGRIEPAARRGRTSGLSYIPGDRRNEGLISDFTLWENLLLRSRNLCRRFGIFISRRRAGQTCRELLERFDINPRDPEARAGHLSGGNQQRFLVGRALCPEPDLLLASCPARGMDLAGIGLTHSAFRRLAADGGAVLYSSRDLDELRRYSDRITAFFAGRSVATCRAEAVDTFGLGLMVTTGRKH